MDDKTKIRILRSRLRMQKRELTKANYEAASLRLKLEGTVILGVKAIQKWIDLTDKIELERKVHP